MTKKCIRPVEALGRNLCMVDRVPQSHWPDLNDPSRNKVQQESFLFVLEKASGTKNLPVTFWWKSWDPCWACITRSNKILFLTQFAIKMCFSFPQRFHFETTSQFGSAGTGFHAFLKLISLTMFDLNLYLCAKPKACRHVTLKGSVYNNWK